MSSTPERIGKYRVIKRLGRGGTAEVYLAEQEGTAGFTKQLVLKVLYKDLAADQDFVKMLVDEARITARLIHANICQVLDLGLDPEAHYLAMEYVPGTDLLTLLEACRQRGVPIPLEVAAHVVAEVLSALDYAHDATDDDGAPLGIIHRDVSPQNILISHHGEVKLTDFGIAKAAQRQTRTQAGQIKGKMIYMSPEHASGRSMDHRADIFSAGIVLHELLRGQPFAAAADSNVVLQMRKAGMEIESIREHRPEVPVELEAALKRALQADPDGRFPSAEAFRAALVAFLFRRPLPFGRSELACFVQSVTPGPARRLAAAVSDPRPTVLETRGKAGGATTDATVRTPVPREPTGGLEAVATCPDDMGAIMAIARQESEGNELFPEGHESGAFEADEEATCTDDPAPLDEPADSEMRPDLQDARTEILDKE